MNIKNFNKIIITSIALLTTIFGFSQTLKITDVESKSVFLIKAYKKGQINELGTGFAISAVQDKLHIVTARHVIENADSVLVFAYNNSIPIKAGRNIIHPVFDVGLVTIDFKLKELPSYIINPEISDLVSFVKPNSNWEIIEGTKSGYIKNVSKLVILINNLIINSGDSGGPVFSNNGIVGMISFTGKNSASNVETININAIRNIIVNDWNIPWQLGSKEISRIKINPSSNVNNNKLTDINIYNITINGKCATNQMNMIDDNLGTAWKCSGSGDTDIYFYFNAEYSIKELRIYQSGFTNKTSEDIPDGYFKIRPKNVNLYLNKLMSYKEVSSEGTWVIYEFKKNIVSKYFCLSLHTGNVYTDVIYEIKVKGYNL